MKLRCIALSLILFAAAAPLAAQTCPTGNPRVAPNARYTVTQPAANERVVVDGDTGLMWKRCPEGMSGANCATGSASILAWSAALAVANGSAYAGYGDWRLPSIMELQSLVESGCHNPAINVATTAAFPGNGVGSYWTSTTYASDAAGAWAVAFLDGLVYASGKGSEHRVRLVRGGRGLDRFAAETDTTPDAFDLIDQIDVPPSEVRTSDPVTVAGLDTDAVTGIGASGAAGSQYSINGGAFTSAPGAVANGDQVRVRHTSAATPATAVTTTLVVGGVSADFVTTTARLDQTIAFGANPGPLVYGASGFANAEAGSGLPVRYGTTTPALCDVDADAGQIATLAVGECIVTADQPGNDIWNPAPQQAQAVQIVPRAVAVAAQAGTKVYGDADPALTYDAEPPLLAGDGFTGALSRAPGEDAGEYAIAQGTLSAGDNYALSFTGAMFTITLATQALDFPVQTVPSRPFVPEASFVVSPPASSAEPNSGQPIVYSSLDEAVCTVNGATATMHAMGNCVLAANQAGDGNFHPAAQATATVTISAPVTADLHVQVSADRDRALIGDTVMWTVVAGNAGPADAAGARLADAPPARLGDVVWECVSGACPDPDAGEHGIDVALDLPAGASARFELLATVLAAPEGEDGYTPIEYGAAVALPEGSGLDDPEPGNDADSGEVLVVPAGIFADGFEAPAPSRPSVPLR